VAFNGRKRRARAQAAELEATDHREPGDVDQMDVDQNTAPGRLIESAEPEVIPEVAPGRAAKSEASAERECAQCGQAFTPKDDAQRYCSKACKAEAKVERRDRPVVPTASDLAPIRPWTRPSFVIDQAHGSDPQALKPPPAGPWEQA
jgi:hypothetical protein